MTHGAMRAEVTEAMDDTNESGIDTDKRNYDDKLPSPSAYILVA